MNYITPDEIARAEQLGACPEAIEWLRTEPRTWEEVVARYADWLILNARDLLTPERLDACAAADPRAALKYAHERLTPERLDVCAAAWPATALRFASDRLTPERLDACAAAEPWAALEFARDLLTPERRAQCGVEIEETRK